MGRNDGSYKRQGLTYEQITQRHLQKNKAFAKWIVDKFGQNQIKQGSGILDIGAGNGYLARELWQTYNIPSTVVEPNPKPEFENVRKVGVSLIQTHFDYEFPTKYQSLFENCTLLIGLHADGATEQIVDCGLKYDIPFAVIPCCCIPSLAGTFHEEYEKGTRTYENFVEYLLNKSDNLAQSYLDMPTKRNIVVYTRPQTRFQRTLQNILNYIEKIDVIL